MKTPPQFIGQIKDSFCAPKKAPYCERGGNGDEPFCRFQIHLSAICKKSKTKVLTAPFKSSRSFRSFKGFRSFSKSFLYALSKVFVFCALFVITACQSVKEPKEVFSAPDYTDNLIKQSEFTQIEKFAEEKPVKALWRALLLGDEDAIARYTDALIKKVEEALETRNYFIVKKYMTTLLTIPIDTQKRSNLTQLIANNSGAMSDFEQSIPGLSLDGDNKKLLPKTLANCIDATLTIWVDRGIRIERGAGYADRVIGSGFFIDKRGYIITNNHVIADLVDPKSERYSRLFVKLSKDNETRIPAKVIGYDKTLDLALLQAKIDVPYILTLGESRNLLIGDSVNAIGAPLGLNGTITKGIVSAIDRKLFTTGSVLQIDAAVNSGNSGGPCIDKDFNVQAIVFAGISDYQGLNFAIPVEYLRQDLPILFNGGKRVHAWLSGFGHTAKNGAGGEGLLVQYVMPGGSLSRAGIVAGDIITFIDGKKVASLEDMQNILRDYTDETILSLNYIHNDEALSAYVYLDERPESPGFDIYNHDLVAHSFLPIFGMALTEIGSSWMKKYIINDVIAGSIADESGFSVNDPLTVMEVRFLQDNTVITANLGTRKRKGGYIDVVVGIGTQLDSPYYF